ncbi:hypothetical protein Agabi119p4_10487 [Agaricus bisporus var. burnettii]|uniref:F-box domain-containing protein n=1 Tax=Agaricus bisporus var. burnettii TaxID=192524 RepID=A0A8H7EWA8_AGABI|nr:hypothetical protein Agabi119p4_10487 [Agaricus bisporus var. burnettii]
MDPWLARKPLPILTQASGAVEHIPVKRTHPSIIRRVSNIFRKRPSALAISRPNMSRIYESRHLSQDSLTDEEDDIRRPSGLGSAASVSSLPPSPFAPTHPVSYPMRASSTPNLLLSYSPPHTRTPTPSFSLLSIPSETIALVFSHLSKSDLAQVVRTCRLFLSPGRVLLYTDVSLDDLPQARLEGLVALLASRRDLTDLTRTFTCETWPPFFQPTSSGTSSKSRSSTLFESPFDPELQHRNTLLTATFTLAFQRMSNLTSLILPSYDHDLLAHHTAFGLQSITFTCSTLSKEEAHELFAWLDGQTNIATLMFPKLAQDTDYGSLVESGPISMRSTSVSITTRPATSNGVSTPAAQGKKFLVAPFLVPLSTASSPSSTKTNFHSRLDSQKSRPKSALPTSPSYATFAESANSSKIPFPSSDKPEFNQLRSISGNSERQHPPHHRHSIFSLTLLPNLTHLHAPPSLVIALAFSSDHNGRGHQRPLRFVRINITSTLYSGLRPATIMSKLIGVTRCLGLYFGENVDRRSVEKVLGSAGSSLGGVRRGGDVVDDDDDVDDIDVDSRRKRRRKEFKFGEGEWKGLIELDVGFAPGGPGSDEKLHKLISSVIPRYPYLRTLRLLYLPTPSPSSSSTNPPINNNNLNISSPSGSMISPMTPTTPQQRSLNHYYPPSFHSSSSNSLTTSMRSLSKGGVENGGVVLKELSPPEKAYVRQWSKYCRDLECVVFLDGAEWVKKK